MPASFARILVRSRVKRADERIISSPPMHSDPTPVPDDEADTTAEGFVFGDLGDIKGRRDLLSRDELLAGLTALIRACEGCEHVSVIEVTQFDKPDHCDGCNWSLALVLDPAGVAPEVYGLAYAAVLETARASWNLAEPKSGLDPEPE